MKLAEVQRLLGADTALLEISLGTLRSWAADLVVLSGCRTALGKEVRGEVFEVVR